MQIFINKNHLGVISKNRFIDEEGTFICMFIEGLCFKEVKRIVCLILCITHSIAPRTQN